MSNSWTPKAWYAQACKDAGARPDYYHGFACLRLRAIEALFPDWSDSEILDVLQKSNAGRLDAVPDLTRYPELRGMRELIEAEWAGFRDGASLSDLEWQAYCDGGFFRARHLSSHSPGGAKSGRCSYIFFPDSEQGPLLGNNLDSSLDEPFGLPHWPLLNEDILWGGVSSGVHRDEVSPEIFPVDVIRLVGQFCRSTGEAVELATRYNDFWGPGNVLVADRTHEAAIMEKSSRRIGVRGPDGRFPYVTSMTAGEPEFKRFLEERREASLHERGLGADSADVHYWNECADRKQLLGRLLTELPDLPSREDMRAILQHRSSDGRICYDGDVLASGVPCEHTLRTTIWALREGRAWVWSRQGEQPSFEAEVQEITFPDLPLWANKGES